MMSFPKTMFAILFLGILLLVGLIVFVDFQVSGKSNGLIYKEIRDVPEVKVGLVLGASVWNNKVMSDMLKDRADAALELYRAGKIKRFLVSGDNRSVDYNEVIVVKNYLLSKDVLEDDIVLDYAGLDTYDSLYRAKEIFGVNELIIATQEFHLPRAIFIANSLGISAYGFVADNHAYKNIELNEFREKLANVKAFFDILLKVKPKFLGDKISID